MHVGRAAATTPAAARRSAANRPKAWLRASCSTIAAWISSAALLSGCATVDVTNRSVRTGWRERRALHGPGGPLVAGTWRRAPRGYVGTLVWQTCDIESHWIATKIRITRSTPRTDLGLPLLAAGAGLALVGGTQAADFEDENCGPMPDPGRPCRHETDYNPGAIGAFILGLGLFSVGTVMVTRQRSVQVEILSRKPETIRTTEACIRPGDLAELRLAIRMGPKQFLPIQIDRDGTTAHIDLPAGLVPPTGIDFPIAAYRVPSGATQLIQRGQTIGHIRFDPEP